MSKKSGSRIFFLKGNILLNFMWCKATSDGSILMGINRNKDGGFIQNVEKIFDGNRELIPGKHFKIEESTISTTSKISFHPSGFYKFDLKIKKINTDRVTVRNLPFKEIKKPERMLEILLPIYLTQTSKVPDIEKDIVLDISNFPDKPLRCTVSCFPVDSCELFWKSRIVDDSVIESTNILECGNLAWAWTVRVSKNDNEAPKTKFYILLLGKNVWPSVIKRIFYEVQSFFGKLFS